MSWASRIYPRSLASSLVTAALWASSSAFAAAGLQRPRMMKMQARKHTTPAMQIQYQLCHCPGAAAAAAWMAPICAISAALGVWCAAMAACNWPRKYGASTSGVTEPTTFGSAKKHNVTTTRIIQPHTASPVAVSAGLWASTVSVKLAIQVV